MVLKLLFIQHGLVIVNLLVTHFKKMSKILNIFFSGNRPYFTPLVDTVFQNSLPYGLWNSGPQNISFLLTPHQKTATWWKNFKLQLVVEILGYFYILISQANYFFCVIFFSITSGPQIVHCLVPPLYERLSWPETLKIM